MLPGLGQWIAGSRKNAIEWFCCWLFLLLASLAAIAFPWLIAALAVLIPLDVLVTLVALVDAFRCGRRSQRKLLTSPLLRYGAGILFIVGAWGISNAIGLFFRSTLIEPFVTRSISMSPDLEPGDRFIMSKRQLELKRWDVVVFKAPSHPGSLWVMRIAGLPGETIELVNGHLHADGVPVDFLESRAPVVDLNSATTIGGQGHPIKLGPGEYYVLGNTFANDSRHWSVGVDGHQPGALPRESIMGKVVCTYWPIARWKTFH